MTMRHPLEEGTQMKKAKSQPAAVSEKRRSYGVAWNSRAACWRRLFQARKFLAVALLAVCF